MSDSVLHKITEEPHQCKEKRMTKKIIAIISPLEGDRAFLMKHRAYLVRVEPKTGPG